MKKITFTFFFLLVVSFLCPKIHAQKDTYKESIPPILLDIDNGDSIKTLVLQDIYVYPPQAFKNKREEEKYRKLIRDVKKTLPYSQRYFRNSIQPPEFAEAD